MDAKRDAPALLQQVQLMHRSSRRSGLIYSQDFIFIRTYVLIIHPKVLAVKVWIFIEQVFNERAINH